jgi:hypothetical protein
MINHNPVPGAEHRPSEVAMPSSYFTMWGLLILMGLGAFGGLIYRGDLLSTFSGAYPSDPGRQDALRRCGEADASFSKFSADDRRACYRAMLPSSTAAAL